MRELGTVEVAPDGVRLRITRRLAAAPEEVWAALTERDALEAWLGRMRYEPRVGSPLTLDFGSGVEIYGEILAFEPPHLFSFTWSPFEGGERASVVHIELRADGPVTTLVLTHSRQAVAMARTTAAGWHAHLDLLIGLVDGDLPDWDDVYPPARDAYAPLVAAL